MVPMSQSIEIEFKNLLSIEEFNRMITYFQLSDDHFFQQINHYFDTKDFSLKNLGCALRIREKKEHFEMTLKQPHPDGLLETTQILTEKEANDLLNGGLIIEGVVKIQIKSLGIDVTNIVYFGSLTTHRAELSYQNGLLVLDCSSYLNTKDYEVEYEVSNREQGEPIFKSLLTELNIPNRKTNNKIQRFYDQKQSLRYAESNGKEK
jgi:uncharacterized protein YjbK